MKTTIRISILLNVILLGGTLLLWRHPRTVMVTVPAPMTASAAKVETQTVPAPVAQMVAAPFHWTQLLSSNDYRSFVANLRTAGCPEATVEDIVRGDTGRAYSMMRARLRVGAENPGPWSAQAQMQMVAYFLGQGPAPAPEVAAAPALPLLVATPPLVVQNVDLSSLKLSDAETQAIANIRETFWNNVGGANQDTNDPAYMARWQKAQNQADTMLHAMLGEQDFQQYQLKAYQMSLTPSGN